MTYLIDSKTGRRIKVDRRKAAGLDYAIQCAKQTNDPSLRPQKTVLGQKMPNCPFFLSKDVKRQPLD